MRALSVAPAGAVSLGIVGAVATAGRRRGVAARPA